MKNRYRNFQLQFLTFCFHRGMSNNAFPYVATSLRVVPTASFEVPVSGARTRSKKAWNHAVIQTAEPIELLRLIIHDVQLHSSSTLRQIWICEGGNGLVSR
jgi:hypothetical protein